MTKVLVFGTFDQLTDGHKFFLQRAKQFGDQLVVFIPEDEFVAGFKGHRPDWPLEKRIQAVQALPLNATVYQEDVRENWRSLKTIKPDVIVLGADQASWRARLDVLLAEYGLEPKIHVLNDRFGLP